MLADPRAQQAPPPPPPPEIGLTVIFIVHVSECEKGLRISRSLCALAHNNLLRPPPPHSGSAPI